MPAGRAAEATQARYFRSNEDWRGRVRNERLQGAHQQAGRGGWMLLLLLSWGWFAAATVALLALLLLVWSLGGKEASLAHLPQL